MPRPRPPHLRHETTRHGKRVWYVRIGGQRIRLRADYGTEEFWRQYHAAVNGEIPQQNGKASSGTLAWLIARYWEVPAWTSLSQATRRQMTKESFGNAFADACRTAGVKKSAHGRCKFGATRAANNGATVAALNGILGWSGSKVASLYTANADRARLSREHMDKMRTKYAAPMGKVRRGSPNRK